MDTCSKSSSPLVNSLVKNRLFKTASDIDEPPFQFIHTMDSSLVDTMLHDSPDLVIHTPHDWDLGCLEATGWVGRKKSLAFLDAAVQLLHVRSAVCRCNVLLEHRVVTWQSAYRWQQYDCMTSLWRHEEHQRSQYHQDFLLCNNNEITACIADLFNSFCEEVYAVAFFKVVKQQTIGKVGNSIMSL